MLDPRELIAVARMLAQTSGSPNLVDAALRRAVSSAYYALFHIVLKAAASRFMGPAQQGAAGFSLIYRGFDHSRMKKTCAELQKPMLKATIQQALGRTTVSQPVQDFAEVFPSMQDLRHLADYDPKIQFLASDVINLIDAAEAAMDDFDQVPPDEQADILALLLVGART